MSTEPNYSELPKLLKTLATDEYCANLTMTPNKTSGTAISAISIRIPQNPRLLALVRFSNLCQPRNEHTRPQSSRP